MTNPTTTALMPFESITAQSKVSCPYATCGGVLFEGNCAPNERFTCRSCRRTGITLKRCGYVSEPYFVIETDITTGVTTVIE